MVLETRRPKSTDVRLVRTFWLHHSMVESNSGDTD